MLEENPMSSSSLHSSSVDTKQLKLGEKVGHLSNEPLQPEPTTIHLSCEDDFPPPEPPVDYEVDDNISRVKCQERTNNG